MNRHLSRLTCTLALPGTSLAIDRSEAERRILYLENMRVPVGHYLWSDGTVNANTYIASVQLSK